MGQWSPLQESFHSIRRKNVSRIAIAVSSPCDDSADTILAIGERIRDKKLLTARQGMYIGGQPKLGLDIVDRRYSVNEDEAKLVRRIFKLAVQLQSCQKIADTLNGEGIRSKVYKTKTGKTFGGALYSGRALCYAGMACDMNKLVIEIDEMQIAVRIIKRLPWPCRDQVFPLEAIREASISCRRIIKPLFSNAHSNDEADRLFYHSPKTKRVFVYDLM